MSEINGILVIDKPAGKTSHDMVNFVRRVTGIRKVGHTGTLDPEATGVLPILIGKATKLSEVLICDDKEYETSFIYGKRTDTQDATGNILSIDDDEFDEHDITLSINKFIGEIDQMPPMYSAIKKDGKKLYELARRGIMVEREYRRVKIHDIDIIDIDTDNKRVKMNVSCSKGTYIRTLCADIGDEIGTGAYMETLRRTKSGCFTIQYSYTPEEIEQIAKADCLKDYILPMEDVFKDLDKVVLDDFLTAKYKNGIKIRRKGLIIDSYYLVYGPDNELLGISKYNGEELVMWKSLWS